MVEYKLKNGNILKDGHTMFLQDVVSDLRRKAYLEDLKSKKDAGAEVPCSDGLSDADSYAFKNLEEYEDIVECKMNQDFRTGWIMARLTNKKLRALGGEEAGR